MSRIDRFLAFVALLVVLAFVALLIHFIAGKDSLACWVTVASPGDGVRSFECETYEVIQRTNGLILLMYDADLDTLGLVYVPTGWSFSSIQAQRGD